MGRSVPLRLDIRRSHCVGFVAAAGFAGFEFFSGAWRGFLSGAQNEDVFAALLQEVTGFISRKLLDRGATRIIAAGGENSGAVASASESAAGLVGTETAGSLGSTGNVLDWRLYRPMGDSLLMAWRGTVPLDAIGHA
jgi:hypothetical protein